MTWSGFGGCTTISSSSSFFFFSISSPLTLIEEASSIASIFFFDISFSAATTSSSSDKSTRELLVSSKEPDALMTSFTNLSTSISFSSLIFCDSRSCRRTFDGKVVPSIELISTSIGGGASSTSFTSTASTTSSTSTTSILSIPISTALRIRSDCFSSAFEHALNVAANSRNFLNSSGEILPSASTSSIFIKVSAVKEASALVNSDDDNDDDDEDPPTEELVVSSFNQTVSMARFNSSTDTLPLLSASNVRKSASTSGSLYCKESSVKSPNFSTAATFAASTRSLSVSAAPGSPSVNPPL